MKPDRPQIGLAQQRGEGPVDVAGIGRLALGCAEDQVVILLYRSKISVQVGDLLFC
jgi:hypothetical protein